MAEIQQELGNQRPDRRFASSFVYCTPLPLLQSLPPVRHPLLHGVRVLRRRLHPPGGGGAVRELPTGLHHLLVRKYKCVTHSHPFVGM